MPAPVPVGEILKRIEVTSTGCWEWQGSLRPSGYGQLTFRRKVVKAHRFFYMQLIGPIPQGKVLDHLCRNRKCVNPKHLEPVTLTENTLRGGNAAKTHCKYGHSLADAYVVNVNTDPRSRGQRRICRTCHKQKWA